ncbi:MAG: glycoside hydrolase family 88 protein [Bacteroidales bacterium]|nr:glycoside hydrolase family 88 protein [Bacteroidales bacterium]
MKKTILLLALCLAACTARSPYVSIQDPMVRDDFEFADRQLRVLLHDTEAILDTTTLTEKTKVEPHSVKPDGSLVLVPPRGWTSGFFPGTMWYLYEMSGDEFWKEKAMKFTEYLESIKTYKGTHDLGFMINCSYGNGERLAHVPGYKEVMLEAARSLSSRFNPTVGCIRSWDHGAKWQFPVIIDNMMNLELLFWASEASGDPSFREIAISHANTTMANHFREDNSSFHVVDYDAAGDGKAVQFNTHQGYADSSAWGRGQAWGLYGFTMCYRKTGDPKYLEQAEKIAAFILSHKNLPEDSVFYWDFDAPDIPDAPRDVSASAVAASALYELSTMSADKGAAYLAAADKIVKSISEKYRSEPGANHGFLTHSSVGNLPGNNEISVPLNYADYYFIEALVRKDRLANGKPVVPAVN